MTVSSWGTGRPDYYKPTIPARPSIADESDTQIIWVLSENYSIESMGSTSSAFYTVQDGYTLSLGSIDISANNSCINQLKIFNGTTLIADFRFDMRGKLDFSSLTGQTLNENEVLNATIYNNDAIIGDFNLTISGVLDIIRTAITEV